MDFNNFSLYGFVNDEKIFLSDLCYKYKINEEDLRLYEVIVDGYSRNDDGKRDFRLLQAETREYIYEWKKGEKYFSVITDYGATFKSDAETVKDLRLIKKEDIKYQNVRPFINLGTETDIYYIYFKVLELKIIGEKEHFTYKVQFIHKEPEYCESCGKNLEEIKDYDFTINQCKDCYSSLCEECFKKDNGYCEDCLNNLHIFQD